MRSHRFKEHYASNKKCPFCRKTLSSKHRLEDHIKRIHKKSFENVERKHQCVYCYQAFFTKGILSRHVIQYHANHLDKSCVICNLKFEHHYELTRHMQRKHFTPVNSAQHYFTCHICSQSFSYRESLMKHLYCHDRKKFKCDKCHRTYWSKKNYVNHIKSPTLCQPKQTYNKISCKECNKEFRTPYVFRRHLLIHSINYRICRVCNANFDDLNTIRKHFKKNHKGERMFHCEYCNVNLSNFKEMMRHRKSHGHKKKFLSAIRINEKLFMLYQDPFNSCQQIKHELDSVIVKTEPIDGEESVDCNKATTVKLEIKSEP